MSDDDFEQTIALNLTSAVIASRQAIPAMRKQGGGAIVNMTSVSARTGGLGGGSVGYATAKAGLSTFTRGLARELAPDGIRVNAVAPGIILTPFHDRHTTDDQMKALLKSIPMGRAAAPQECVGAVLFLASNTLSSYITGQVIEVNGGQLTP